MVHFTSAETAFSPAVSHEPAPSENSPAAPLTKQQVLQRNHMRILG
jgi:sigma-B regulation protein RsbQ